MTGFLADRDAFSAFYRAHVTGLLVFFTRSTFDPEAALDLTAETFASAFASRASQRGQTEAEAGGWLYVIARRQLARYFQAGVASRALRERLGVAVPVASDGELERIEQLADLAELRSVVRAELHGLDHGQRDALWLRVVEERPYAEVAARLSITEPTARARVSRALRTLAESLRPSVPAATEETP